MSLLGYLKVIPYTKFEHFGFIHFWVTFRTNKHTDRQANIQTDGAERPTQADRQSNYMSATIYDVDRAYNRIEQLNRSEWLIQTSNVCMACKHEGKRVNNPDKLSVRSVISTQIHAGSPSGLAGTHTHAVGVIAKLHDRRQFKAQNERNNTDFVQGCEWYIDGIFGEASYVTSEWQSLETIDCVSDQSNSLRRSVATCPCLTGHYHRRRGWPSMGWCILYWRRRVVMSTSAVTRRLHVTAAAVHLCSLTCSVYAFPHSHPAQSVSPVTSSASFTCHPQRSTVHCCNQPTCWHRPISTCIVPLPGSFAIMMDLLPKCKDQLD